MPEKNAVVVVDELKSQMSSVDLDLNKNVKLISSIVENLLSSYKSNPESFENGKGISFLSMKNILMIEYLLNLLNLTYLKSNGKKISGSSCVQRLAEIRCVLEKTKSIEVKLKYQIDKLLKIAVSSANEHDSLSFKANIDNFAKPENESDEEEEDDEDVIKKGGDEDEEEEMEGTKKDGIYRPPKLAPVYNDIDQTQEEKTRREMERLKRRAMSSSIMKEIEKEYAETPEEIKDNYANTIEYETNEHKHRVEYEEENFVRKPLVKSEMQALKRLKRGANLNSLSSFDDARVILDENINAEDFLSKKKEKKKLKSNKSKKGGKKGGKKKKKIRYT